MEAQVLHDDSLCTVSLYEEVVLIDIHEAIRVEHVEFAEAAAEQVAGPDAGRVGVLVRVAEGVALPTAEARARFATFLRAQHGRVRSIHVALEGRGFWAATMTALVASVARSVPFGPPILVYDELERAAADLVARLRVGRESVTDGPRLARVFRRAG